MTSATSEHFSKHAHIQDILRKTKIYGTALFIAEFVAILLMGFVYISINHPYFTQRVLPNLLIDMLTWISAIVALPVIYAGPVILILLVIADITALFCLVISIQQLRKWKALNLLNQNYGLAIRSIIYNSFAIIPTIFLLYSIITRYSL